MPDPTKSPADSLGNFAELVAAGTPTPGGGSVAAYCGVLATALGRMMCNLTIGKRKYADVEPRIAEINSDLERLGAELRRLIDEDAVSFEGVLAAYRLPKETDEQKSERSSRIAEASRHATDVPFRTARQSLDVLKLLGELGGIGNQNALPDVNVAAQLARTAICGAYYNILVNLAAAPDAGEAEATRGAMQSIIDEAGRLAAGLESRLTEG
jgi:glutamate formiminotransferase/formiminotetrahydrofolate cyclodeaminase